jgi:hypothetical protein
MRPFRTTLADHPGTIYHAARGLCQTCYRIEPKFQAKAAEDRPSIEQIRLSLQAYLDRRRPFRIKAGAL